MGIRDEIHSALSDAFDNDLSDVVCEFNIYKAKNNSKSYDVDAGSRPRNDSGASESRGIFSVFKNSEIDGERIKVRDEKLIINGFDISVVLEIGDEIVLKNGKKYFVISPNPIMGGDSEVIIYKAQVRKNG